MAEKLAGLSDPRLWFMLLGGIMAIGHYSFDLPEWLEYSFFGILLISTGIPHGAIDHLIEEKTATTLNRSFSLDKFLATYLLQMGLYAVLWFFMPALSLSIFLILSAWHFGESDFQPAPRHLMWKLSQALWGALVLFFILMRDPLLTGDIIARITQNHEFSVNLWLGAVSKSDLMYWVLGIGLIVSGMIAQFRESISWRRNQIAYIILLLLIIYFLPLLPAFALYFGGWHALNTFRHMSEYLGDGSSPLKLWKAALPFTMLAFFFLITTGGVWYFTLSEIDPVPILFIFIAIITLPHLVVMNKMFSNPTAARE